MDVSAAMVDWRVARRRLHPLHRGVYAVGHLAVTQESRWMAAVLASGPGAVLSHRAAGELWGLVPRGSGRLEVTRSGHHRARPGIVGRKSCLPPDERTVADGIPVTSVPRTVLDLAAVVPERRLERALNEVEVRGLRDRLSVPGLLERHPGRRGAAALRRLLAESDRQNGVTASKLEDEFLALVDRHGFPRPRLNADLRVGEVFLRPDCLWPEQRLIVELDGRAVHRTPMAFERDRERDRTLVADGWRVVRVTWRQLYEEPGRVAGDLDRLLAASPVDRGQPASGPLPFYA